MAELDDYTKMLESKNIPSASPGAAAGGLPAVPLSSYLPASSYATTRPPAVPTTPGTVVNFNKGQLPAGAPMDWQNIISSNPGYMQWALGAGERADTAASQRKAAMRALAIRFGGLPGNFGDVYGDIDPETARIASENPESESARGLRSYTQQVEESRRQLAARGMLQSGELGYGQERLDQARQASVYDMNNEFAGAASGALGQYSGVIAGLNADQIEQIRGAADQIAQQRLYQAQIDAMNAQQPSGPSGPGPEAPTPPPTTTAGGVTGPEALNPNDPNSPWNKYSWGGQTAKQTWDAMRRAGYSEADADAMTFRWMNNMGQADTTYGSPNFAPTTVKQFRSWRTTGGF